MSCLYTWWNLDKETIPRGNFGHIKEVSSWWNPANYNEYFNDFIAMGQLTKAINSATADYKEVQIVSEQGVYVNADIRLDNREVLLKKLSIRDPNKSDSSLLLKSYLEYGEACVNHLVGAFAFSIWDSREGKLFCARDHIGIKPFNYFFDGQHFLFGSQKKSILASGLVPADVDFKFIVNKMNNNMAVKDRTENLHIKKLLPAHCIVLTQSGISIRRYWELDINQPIEYKNDQDYVDHFLELFQLAIKDRSQGSHHIGAHLSGGLDSSGIAALSAQYCRAEQKQFYSFSYTFPEEKRSTLKSKIFDYNDLVDEQIALSQIKNSIKLTKATSRNIASKITYEALVCDGISWSNNVNTEYEIQEASQQHKVGVLLSGFLGDELVTSFCRPYYLEYLERGDYLKFFRAKHRNKYKPNYLAALFAINLIRKLGLPVNESKLAKIYQRHRIKRNKKQQSTLFTDKYVAQNEALKKALKQEHDQEIHDKIPLSLKEYQRNHISRSWTSRRIESENLAALPFNVEYRYPMADIRLLQFAISVPVEQKRTDQLARWLFRRSMKGYVPDSIRLGIKHNTVLKPMIYFTDNSEDNSLQLLLEDLRQSNVFEIINESKIQEALLKENESNNIYQYAILALLAKQNKLKF